MELLFRSAAGLAGLGDLAQRLEAEAETLWGPRKRAGRAYTVAADALEADLRAADLFQAKRLRAIEAERSARVKAAREAMVNAAKHSGADVVDVYAEVSEASVQVFVRDRGRGFDPD